MLFNKLHDVKKSTKYYLKRISSQNYFSAKAHYNLNLHLLNLRSAQPPILIYQMGKVGSSTITSSLQRLLKDRLILQIHYLTQPYLSSIEQKNIQDFYPGRLNGYRHHWESLYLRKQIDKGLKDKQYKIVTLVREPISRNISSFFENLEIERIGSSQHYKVKSFYGFETTVDIGDPSELIRLFFETFDHDTPLVFFDREFKGVLGIDVFASEFPKSTGYQIYKDKHAEVLLIRLEDLNKCIEDAFREFLDIEHFTTVNKNIGDKKKYREIYRRFLDSIVLPESYVDMMYNSKYMQHFYSLEEINRFREKWLKK